MDDSRSSQNRGKVSSLYSLIMEERKNLPNLEPGATLASLERQAEQFQEFAKQGKLKWQKKRNKMTHLTPKKKKRK